MLWENYLPIRNDLIVRKVNIQGILEALEPIHIGSGNSLYTNYLEVIKGSDGKPFIPGTSLKGVLRSIVEIEYSKLGAPVCPGTEINLKNFIKDAELINEAKLRYKNYFDKKNFKVRTCGESIDKETIQMLSSPNQNDVLKALNRLNHKLCEACKIFGTAGLLGSATVFDAPPIQYRLGTRPSLNVKDKKLFNIEYVEDGSTFKFLISLRNPANYMVGAIILALKDLKEGKYKIGGLKSRGFGLITLKEMSMEIKSYSELGFRKKEGLIYLLPLDPKDVEVELESTIITDPDFFKKTEQFVLALKTAFSGGVESGKREVLPA